VKGATGGVWAPDGRTLLTNPGGFGAPQSLEIVPAGGGEGRVLLTMRDPASDVAPFGAAWSADGRVVFFLGWDPKDPSLGIWSVPAAGGLPRLMVRFDDPVRPWHQHGFKVRDNRFYFTVGDRQSDIWTTAVTGSR
jgi:hypothetical protein